MTKYELVQDKEEQQPHPAFETEYVVENGLVTFKLQDNLKLVKDDYSFFIKVSADGGDVNWANNLLYTFKVGCGQSSTVVSASSDTQDPDQWVKVDHESFFKISQVFTSTNLHCPITTYTVMPDDGELEVVDVDGTKFVQP